ncbi:hypothetical protein NC653_014655 [Populus alba x Populus x berolinensis]|uniref:DUF4283 domain-containing protein n=2 Tax=Populus TaxID=3689 RepID=A0A4U5Q1N8_POPAL|nr:hypothetical protein NC653_014655 [Populus alba x Populus x berolinensis]TKS03431.1 hypothetical protein D5086_0000154280 [Populus alba]
MGSTQALISFASYDAMMEAFEKDISTWRIYFDELRPSIISDDPIDRFAWVEITDLPIICWNASAITKVLSSYGRVIGFDKISYRYSSLGYTNILIGTRRNRFITESVTIQIRGSDYKIQVTELDPLNFPVFEAIEDNIRTFSPMLDEEDDETESTSDSYENIDAADTDSNKDGVPQAVGLERDVDGMRVHQAQNAGLFASFKDRTVYVASNGPRSDAGSTWKSSSLQLEVCGRVKTYVRWNQKAQRQGNLRFSTSSWAASSESVVETEVQGLLEAGQELGFGNIEDLQVLAASIRDQVDRELDD